MRYSEIRSLSLDQALAARAEALRDMQKIIDTAEAAKRGFTGGERRRLNDFESTITALDDHVRLVNGGFHGAGARAAADMNGEGEQRTLGEWAAPEFRSVFESSGGGAYIVPTEYLPAAWDRLAADSVGLASGFTVIDTIRDELRFPKVTSDQTAAFVAEGAAISESDPGIAEVVATPRKLAALTAVSNEAIADANPQVLDMTVFRPLLRSLALGLDKAFYEGDGIAPNIRGLKHVTATQSVDMAAAAFTNLDPFADAIGLLAEANADATAIVMSPTVWADLTKLKEQTTGNNKPLLQESAGSAGQGIERRIYGVPVYLSSQLAGDTVYVYEAAEIAAVRRQEARIELDRSRLFNQDMSEVRGILRFDLAVPNTAAVCLITNYS
jgi:HK97 family phage major capsid protein